MELLYLYLLLINAATLVLMLADKEKAKRNLWRIPEATLLGAALAGGSLGVLSGMYLFRHKTRKPVFYLGIPGILAVQMLLFLLISQSR